MATQIGQLKYSIGFDVKKQDLNALKTQLQQLKKLSLSDLMKINQSDRTAATQTFLQIREQAQYVEKALREAFNTKLNTVNIQTFNKSLKESKTSLQQVYNAFKQGGAAGQNAFRSLITQVTTTNTQLKQTHKFLDNIATTLANTIKWNIASAAVNTLSNSIQQAWGYVKSLDTSLNDIMIVTGKSSDQMAKFSEQANKAATSLGKTTVDYTKAALIYAQQGLNDEEIAARAAITLKTANVTGQSADAVSEQLTAVWNGYKVNAEQAELYIDRLAAVAATTASDLEQLSTGMSKVASAAAAMGVGEDQLAAQLSTIISVTRQAPESVGTALRTVYARISDIKAGIDEDGVTLGNYSGKMAELGFNVLDAAGNLRDMGGVIEQIGGKWATLTREQQVNLAQVMAGQRQYSNLIALFDNFDKYTSALNTAQNAAGTLQKQQDTYMESTQAHLNQLKAATQDLYDSLVNTDSIEPLIDKLTTAVSLVAKFVDALGGGGNVLLTLGGIAVNVFSDHLTKGIETFVHNLTLGNQQVKLMESNLEMLQQVGHISNLDNTTRGLAEAFSMTEQKLAKRATPEEFKQMNESLKDVTESFNSYNSALESTQELEEEFQNAQQAIGKDFGKMKDFAIEADSTQQQFFNTLQKTANEYGEVINSINTFSNSLENQNGLIHISSEAANDFIEQLNSIKETNFAGDGFEQAQGKIDEFISTIDDLKNQGLQSDKFKDFTDEISEYFQQLVDKTGGNIDAFREKLQEVDEQREKSRQKAEAALQQLEQIQTEQRIRAIGKLVGSFTQLTSAIKITSNAFNELRKGNIGSGFTGLITSLTTVTTAAISAGKAIKALGTTVKTATALGIAIAAIELAVSGLVAWKTAAKQTRQAQIDLNNTTIENQQKNQQQIDKKQQLLSTIKNLNEEYENGQITRKELRDEIERLCNQYGIEQGYIDNLIDRYGDLAQGIKQVRIEAAKQKQESLQTELQAAKGNVTDYTGKTVKSKGSTSTLFNEQSQLGKIISSYGGTYKKSFTGGGQVVNRYIDVATLPTNEQQAIELYNRLLKDIEKYADDPLYDVLKKWMDEIEDSATKYNNVKEKLDSYLDYTIFSNKYADFDNTKTFEEYSKQREELINNVAKGDADKVQQVTRAVDKYLKQNYKGLYNQYDEALKYINELEKRFNSSISNNILNSIKELDASHLNELQRLDASGIITSWESLQEVIASIANLDLSNVQEIANTNIEATDRYTFFKSLEDQIKSGKNISSKQIQRFADYDASSLQQYFTMMANGQYKMTGDAKQFYETIQKFELSGFYDQIANLKKTEEQLFVFAKIIQNYNDDISDLNTFNFQDLTQSSVSYNQRSKFGARENARINQFRDLNNLTNKELNEELGITRYEDVKQFNKQLAEQQLELLSIYKQQAGVLQTTFNQWQVAVNTGNLSLEQAEAIANAIEKIGDKSENLVQNFQQTQEELKQIEQRLYDALNPIDSDINESTLFALTQTIRDVAGENNEFAESLQDDARASENLAQAILRFNDAIEDMVANYESWHGILTSETVTIQELAEVIQPLRDAYADLLDMDGSSLSSEFLQNVQNLQLMKEAIDGNIDSYNELKQLAAEDLVAHLVFDTEQARADFENEFTSILEWMQDHKAEFKVGASFVGQEEFMNSLTNLINATQMTATQAQDLLLNAFGINAEVIQETKSEPVKRTITGYDYSVNYQKVRGTDPLTRSDATFYIPSAKPKIITQEVTEQVPAVGTALKILNANASAGGEIKWKHSSQGAGYAGVTRRTKEAETAAKAAKASEPKIDTSTKDTKTGKQDDRDIYHDINLELENINRELSRAQKVQDRLFGKQLIANLNKQSQILEQHKAKLREKLKLQQLDLAQKKEQLRLLGVIVNEQTGDIENYLEALGAQQGAINGLISQYNSIVGSYNATTDKQAKDVIKDQLTQIERSIKNAETDYKNLESKIKNYDDLRKAYQDIIDEIEEQTQKQIEIQITKFRMEVEIRLDMGQAERDWNKFRREVLQADSVLKDTSFDKLLKNANQNYNDIESYFNIHGNEYGEIQKLTDQLNGTLTQLEQINQQSSEVYGDNKKQLMEDLQTDLDSLTSKMQDIEGLIQDIDQAYLDTYDDIKDQMNKQIDDYEFVNDLIEHDIDLLQLLYGDKQYAAMNSFYDQQHENQLQQIDFLRQSVALVKERWEMQEAAGNINAAEKLKEQYKDLVNDLNTLVEASIKTLQDKYTNAINQIFDALDKRVTGGLGTDYLQMEWELMNKNADEYLDTINAAFALQELETKFQKAIDDSKDVKNQQALTKLMDEQLSQLRAKEKLTQYDVDRAEKLLQIEQVRAQLEDTRSAKTSLRLKRDSQGNYSYVYTANEEEVQAAEDNLAKLQNDLYNFDKDAYRKNLDDMLSAWKDFQSRYKEIVLDTSLTEEERVERLALLRDQYGEYINNKVAENEVIRTNLMASAFESYTALYENDYQSYQSMINGEMDLIDQLVPQWNSGIQKMADAFAGAGGFIPACQQGFDDLDTATKNYQTALSELQTAAGEDFGRIRQGAINPTTEDFKELIIQNDALIESMKNQLDTIDSLKVALDQLKEKYDAVWKAAKDAAQAAHDAIQAENERAAQEAANNALTKPEPVQETTPNLPSTSTATASIPATSTGNNIANNITTNQTPTVTAAPAITTTGKNIAGNIYWLDSLSTWGSKTNETSWLDKLLEIYGSKAGKKLYDQVKYLIEDQGGRRLANASLDERSEFLLYSYERFKKMKASGLTPGPTTNQSFATGGYTGEWGTDGKIAVLHQKQLVLNASDTKNMLDSVSIIRDVVSNLGGNISSKLRSLNGGYIMPVQPKPADELQQSVNIQASFPNVNSKREIEEAFSELVNLAAQRAMKRTR